MDAYYSTTSNIKRQKCLDACRTCALLWLRKGGNQLTQKLLKVAIENQRWDVAAHALVLGMVKAKIDANEKKKRSSPRKSKRP